jgi:hypothetical protein
MRCVGSTESADRFGSLPGFLWGSPCMSSATDACRSSLNATQPGQELEEFVFKLASVVGGDGLQAAEVGYPVSQ